MERESSVGAGEADGADWYGETWIILGQLLCVHWVGLDTWSANVTMAGLGDILHVMTKFWLSLKLNF